MANKAQLSRVSELGPLNYLFAVWQIVFVGSLSFSLYFYRWTAILIYAVLFYLTALLDAFVVNPTAASYNWNIAKANGYTPAKLLLYFSLIPVLAWIPLLLIFDFGEQSIGNSLDLPTYLSRPFNWGALLLSIICVDIAFVGIHRFLLHGPLYSAHLLHHTATKSSFFTNCFFSPVDLVLEFGAPAMILLMASIYVGDFNLLFTSSIVLNLWYVMDHSEVLKLPHYYHHAYCRSAYFAYMKFSWPKDHDSVRAHLKKCFSE